MSITRAKPFDLQEVKETYGDVTLSEAIAAMQNTAQVSFACPKCVQRTQIEVDPKPTGMIQVTASDGSSIDTPCDICNGYLATAQEYQEDPDNPGSYIPVTDDGPADLQEPA